MSDRTIIILIILVIAFGPSLISWIFGNNRKKTSNNSKKKNNTPNFNDKKETLEWALYLFGLTHDSNIEELDKIYKKLIVLYHPDQNDSGKGNLDRTIELNNARDFLKKYWEENNSWK